MIYRGPGFLWSTRCLSFSVSPYVAGLAFLTGERERGWRWSQIIRWQENPFLYKSFKTLWCEWWEIPENRRVSFKYSLHMPGGIHRLQMSAQVQLTRVKYNYFLLRKTGIFSFSLSLLLGRYHWAIQNRVSGCLRKTEEHVPYVVKLASYFNPLQVVSKVWKSDGTQTKSLQESCFSEVNKIMPAFLTDSEDEYQKSSFL